MNLRDLTIKNVHNGLREKKFSAFELAKAFFDHIETADKKIGAYLSLHKDDAYKSAEQVDIAIAKDEEISPLAGVPLAIKDNILIKNHKATAASQILKNYEAAYDATVIKKLKSENAIFLGKTNLDEFAMGSSTENSSFQLTHNPHDLERVPGGSSGGSAAAVSANLAVAALGSDTGGSIREPAAFCGVVGLKPTYGAVSRYGLIAMASSLDQIGPITKTVLDAGILFKSISGFDPQDATSAKKVYGDDFGDMKLSDVKKLTVGLPEEYFVEGLEKETHNAIEEAIQKIKSMGLKFKKISLPHTKYALSTYYIIMPAEVSSNLARFDGIRYGRDHKGKNLLDLYLRNKSEGFGPEVKRRIILGTFVLSSGYYDAYYTKAQKVRSLIKADFDEAFKEVDVILTPVSPTRAFKIAEKQADPLAMYLSDIFTIPVNLAGLPALAMPVNSWKEGVYGASGLPVGFQLIGKHWHEGDLLSLGRYYERL